MKKNNTKKLLLISILLFIIGSLVFLFLYLQTQKNSLILKEGWQKQQEEISRQNEIRSIDRMIKSMEGKQVLFESHFVQSSDVVPFLNKIEDLATKAGTKIEVSLVDLSPGFDELVVEMKIGGIFDGIYRFITLLENSPYEIEFLSVNIDNNPVETFSKDNNFKWEANFKLKLLSFIK